MGASPNRSSQKGEVKTEIRFCQKCKKNIRHDIYKNSSIGERIWFGIFTLGFHELMVRTFAKCQVCGNINELSKG